jgi:nitroimidazol reductase NimA-like FMN-containing flavoprotein (pyridoxamine 5'-phosphate oxidase superfamily)
MTDVEYGVEMDDEEIAAFLTNHGHGVLSLGGDAPYGVPVSFGYDVLEHRCVLQLVFGPESRKREYIDGETPVSLTSYDYGDVDDWASVIVEGTLRRIEDDAPAAVDAAEIFAPYATVVSMTVFETPAEDLVAEWYELAIESTSGRRSLIDED